MLNVHLSYKPTSYRRIIFWFGGRLRQFSHLGKFRALLVPSRVCRNRTILQFIMEPTEVLPNGQQCLIIKGVITVVPVHAPIPRNIIYG